MVDNLKEGDIIYAPFFFSYNNAYIKRFKFIAYLNITDEPRKMAVVKQNGVIVYSVDQSNYGKSWQDKHTDYSKLDGYIVIDLSEPLFNDILSTVEKTRKL